MKIGRGARLGAVVVAGLIGLAPGLSSAQSDEDASLEAVPPRATAAAPAPTLEDVMGEDDAAAPATVTTDAADTADSVSPIPGLKPTITDALPRSVVRPARPAQTAALPVTGPIPLLVDREAEARAEFEPLGLRLGSFIATATSTSTVGATRSSVSGGDEVYAGSVGAVELKSDWERHSLDLKLGGGLKKSLTGADELAPEADASLEGALDLTAVDRLVGGLAWSRRSDDDYDDKTYDTLSASGGYARAAGLIGLRTSLAADRTLYEAGDDRDNLALSGELRLSLDNGALIEPFVEVGAFGRLFDRDGASDGLDRSGLGGEALIGVSLSGDRLKGEIAVGYAYEDINASGLADLRGMIAEGKAEWTPTDLLTVAGVLTSTFEPSTLAGSAGSVNRSGEVTVTYAFAPNAYVLAGGALAYEDWAGLARHELTATLRAGAGYRFNRNVEVGVGLAHKIVDSSETGGDYNETTVEARLTLKR